ncbi:MAG: PASTA domain-containing protein [Lawsonibacter sp.]|nr:PASTA domain-containing protein [Lawsonibacter sp.]
MGSKYERGVGRGVVTTSATRGSHSKRSIFRRTLCLMAVCGLIMFIPIAWRLWDIAIVHQEEYQKMAARQWELDFSVSAQRGNIYDRNGNIMAMSATVYKLILSPKDLMLSVSNKDEDGHLLESSVYEAKVAARQDQMVEELMTLFPDLNREKVVKQVHATNVAYWEVKVNIEEEEKQVLQEYITQNKESSYLRLMTSTKRYYPYSSLAAQTLGFVNANGGAYGIEAVYNDLLEGVAGRVFTTRTAGGAERYNTYAGYIDAENGYNLTLTIDATIQSYMEKALEEGIEEYDIQNGAFCIAMDPKTGAVLGIASSPDFDPNSYSRIVNERLSGQIEEDTAAIFEKLKADNPENLSESELLAQAEKQARSDAQVTQWRNKAIDSRYEPGSTFKALVLAAALEEGLVSENDTFECTGSVMVPGYPEPIRCSSRKGHGHQTLAKAVGNSCNPAFIEIGSRLGKERFYQYFQAFGMMESTGIDLPGEASLAGAFWDLDKMTNVDLAVGSFGQRFEVTPLQMICGFATVINGGNLVKPYVVQSVSTQDGTIIQNTEPEIIRQVVSKQTSQRAADILEQVVTNGTGSNAYVAGYRIGGKTGSSEVKQEADHTIVSFMGYAPADDPKVIVLMAFDNPKVSEPGSHYSTTGRYISGGGMAGRKVGPLIAQILDYMGVEKIYSSEESAAVDVSMPKVTGSSLTDAQKTLAEKNLNCRTVGEGSTVSRQVPAAGASIPGGSTVILYLGEAAPEEVGTVPNVTGMTYEAAKNALEKEGFFMRSSGVPVYYGNSTTAERQSINGGETAAIGTVIDVRFFNEVEDSYVNIG